MTSCLQTPSPPHRHPALTINCGNKRSIADTDFEDCYGYLTPPTLALAMSWKRKCTGAHCFSPPPTPRGKQTIIRHFDFDEEVLAALCLPDFAMPEPPSSPTTIANELPTTPTKDSSTTKEQGIGVKFHLKPRFSYPLTADMVLPVGLDRAVIPRSPTPSASPAVMMPPLSPVQEAAAKEQDAASGEEEPEQASSTDTPSVAAAADSTTNTDQLLMPPPRPVETPTTTTTATKLTHTTKSDSSHPDHLHESSSTATAWHPKLPHKPSRAGTEYARCA